MPRSSNVAPQHLLQRWQGALHEKLSPSDLPSNFIGWLCKLPPRLAVRGDPLDGCCSVSVYQSLAGIPVSHKAGLLKEIKRRIHSLEAALRWSLSR
ncbi:hypothetical protein AVEN_179046-1 [Araneus ventricosus]|uniref:Uncharacterized protein n=1 Tax=Araneus ventricosus TaxID=182803 RepID=A0A4Y2WV51_ARAVE|nr:hypothetical protein AVEN_179046-1 [Araneus ventricosus]